MRYKSLVFLGGLFPKHQKSFITSNSTGIIQNAADSFQWNLINGLENSLDSKISILNLPFIGSWPNKFKKIIFPPTTEFTNNTLLQGISFLNIPIIKHFSRFLSALMGLIKIKTGENQLILVYSCHLPFLAAALVYKKLYPSVTLMLILPDLPEYMGSNGFIVDSIKKLETPIVYKLIKKFDLFVVLTKYMIEKIGVPIEKATVIEGISSPPIETTSVDYCSTQTNRSFFYSGTLSLRYGIKELVDAFTSIEDKTIELWICGDGDGSDYVKSRSKIDGRIRFFGQISREKAIQLQHRATILVNPRQPDDIYTKYSFPSKIMEYMSSGRPVIMYHLDGIPSEYDGLFIKPKSLGVDGLRSCMIESLDTPEDLLTKLGNNAKNFVLEYKNPTYQAKKIIKNLLRG